MFTIITGSQFGDEGKGNVVRFQGGNNAGHTLYRLFLGIFSINYYTIF